MKTVYALQFTCTSGSSVLALCETQDLARVALAAKKVELSGKPGIRIEESTVDKFAYSFGWASQGGIFWVKEMSLATNMSELPE
jgi:hypothetical protein